MPIHLPQITRRNFLKKAALSAAALALAPEIHASLLGKSRDKNTFAFFSDCHIAANPATVSRGVNMTDNLSAIIRDFLAWPVKPEVVVVNGDLALQDGQPADYTAFGHLIDAVRTVAPVRLSLGNHDQRDNFRHAFPHDATSADIGGHRQVSVYSSEYANWFQLDSLQKTASTPGELGNAQLDWLSQQLAAHPDKPAIIVNHHNLITSTENIGLIDTGALEAIFVNHPQVKAYIYGHTHDWHVSMHYTGVHLVNLPPTAYVFKDGRPSGWVRATIARDGAEFELRCLDRKHPEHGQIKQVQWRTV